MLETFTVSFFGHRYIDNFRKVEERVERQIRQLIESHEFVEFLVGRDGDFDQIVSSAVIRAKKNIRDDNSVAAHITNLLQGVDDNQVRVRMLRDEQFNLLAQSL